MRSSIRAAALAVGAGLLVAGCASAPGAGHGTGTTPGPAAPLWLQSLQMVSPQAGWAVRWTGSPALPTAAPALARTTDGGRTWANVTPAAAVPLLRPAAGFGVLFARDAERAWLALPGAGPAETTVFATADGGRRWAASAQIPVPGIPTWLDFTDAEHGWLMQDLGAAAGTQAVVVLRTVDGGARWVQVARTAQPGEPGSSQSAGLPAACDKTGIGFATATTGWVTLACPGPGPGVAYVTHDGGARWLPQPLPVPATVCAPAGCLAEPPQFFGAAGFLTAAGSGGPYLLTTRDAGTTWSRGPLPPSPGQYPRISFTDARHGFLVPAGPQGRVAQALYVTSDSGRTWAFIRPDRSVSQPGITFDFVTAAVAFAWIPAPGTPDSQRPPPLWRTLDGGHTWVAITPVLAR